MDPFPDRSQAGTIRCGTFAIADDGPQILTAEGISFTYSGAAAPAFDGIDLDLKRDESPSWSTRTAPARAASPAS
ncbi:hypothetical protein [Streptomyces sp. NPDC018045]|uniref:hypothetical protein n=1 Tax=Streptomyces sp. NPDC018045 TaxID=3365037 RepID=UPI0037AB307A